MLVSKAKRIERDNPEKKKAGRLITFDVEQQLTYRTSPDANK